MPQNPAKLAPCQETTAVHRGAQRVRSLLTAVIAGVLGVVVSLAWIRSLRPGFWVDECVTYWVASGGPSQIFSRSLLSLQSPLQALVSWAAMKATGSIEFGMRMPSVLATLLAAALLYRLVRRIADSEAALFAVAYFLCFPFVLFAATDARPYACAMAAFLGALQALMDWKETGAWRQALLFALLSALTVHFQILFLYAYAVFAVSWLLLPRKAWPARNRQLAAIAVVVLLLLSPLSFHFKTMIAEKAAKSVSPAPTFLTLLDMALPSINQFSLFWSLAAGAFTALMAAALGKTVCRRKLAASRPGMAVMLAAAVLPLLMLFAVSRLAGAQVFIPRYAILSVAPAAVLFAWAFRVMPAACAYPGLVVFMGLQFLGFSHAPLALHENEGWREAARLIRTLPGDGPVLVRSGLAEAGFPRYLTGRYAGYLSAPIAAYPVGSKNVIPLPFHDSPQVHTYLRDVYTRAALHDSFLVLTSTHVPDTDVIRALTVWANQDGLAARQIGSYGRVNLWQFSRSQSASVSLSAGRSRFSPPPDLSPQ
jgi:Dolichyl-phosphate-mannose-protein mannosyltransferase